ncbi:MAG TPA: hypothetical protein VHB98_03775 [Chloroflexota bacterium]|jgi:hypothetical protein|nr:hypothetical protein [Chloroflexota bacterium]
MLPEGSDDFISLKRAAQLSGISADLLRRRIHQGKLRATKAEGAWSTTRRWLLESLSPVVVPVHRHAGPLPIHRAANTELPSLEGPDDPITLVRAAELSGVLPTILRADAHRGRLWTVKQGLEVVTTRRRLHRYLLATHRERDACFLQSADYVAPE